MDTGTDHHVNNRRKDHAGDRSILLSRYPHPTSPMPDRYVVGDVIAGRYDVLAVHKGAMGIVYATFDSKARPPRALKTLQERFAPNPAALEPLLQCLQRAWESG